MQNGNTGTRWREVCLYSGSPLASNRYLVKHRIVHTSGSTMVYQGDPNHVLGGVVSFWEALRYW